MSEPVFLNRDKHCITRKNIDKGALHILYTLKDAKYRGTLVGGCIRDMLCGLKPKDFDIATDAPPEKIRRLFRRCFIIGRRFRLAHVYTGKDEFIEVATYRGPVDEDAKENKSHPQANNTYGTIAEDALRRDFTINALYYDINGFSIIDYVGGLDDIKSKTVRMIGDPKERIIEDPVRIIRAVKYAAKLGFEIEKDLYKQCINLVDELSNTSSVRRLEELFKILTGGYGSSVFKLLSNIGAIKHLAPFSDSDMQRLGERLSVVDSAVAEGYKFTRGVLMGVLYYEHINTSLAKKTKDTGRYIDPFSFFVKEFNQIAIDINLPKVDREAMRSALMQQSKFDVQANKNFNKKKFVHSRYFKDALDLFEIIATAQGDMQDSLDYWRELVEKYSPLPSYDNSKPPKTKRRRRRKPRPKN